MATDPCTSSAKEQQRVRVRVGGRWTPEYAAFNSARQRCGDPNCKGYKDYGGRGIKFLFRNFTAFVGELGPRPTSTHTLDRINNDGNYEPGNVRWATRQEQNLNRRKRTVCKHGHPLIPENLGPSKGRDRTQLRCLTCHREREKRYRKQKKGRS